MSDRHRPFKISPRTKYFVVVFAIVFTLAFAEEHFLRAGRTSRGNPAILLVNEPAGRSAVFALIPALLIAFLATKKKFD
jgi:hypothetical protein